MEKKNKKKVIRLFLFLFFFTGMFSILIFFLKNKTLLSFLEHSERLAVKSFHILGLDGKAKDPRREKEKRDLENTTAEIEVLKVGEEMIYFPEFAFYLLSYEKEIEDSYGKRVWSLTDKGKKLRDLVIEDVVKELIQLKIIVSEAKKAGLSISEMEAEEILKTANEQMINIDSVLVAKYYLDPELLSRLYAENFLADKFYYSFLKNTKKREETEEEEKNRFRSAYDGWERKYEIRIFEENLNRLRGSDF